MQLGMTLPQTGDDPSRERIARAAREAEAIGLDSLWVLDRLLRPLRPVAPAPGAPARPLPASYASVFDPLETLAFVAAITERILLGVSAILALFQPPILLARRLATLDRLSGGRAVAVLAQGWMPDEFDVAAVPLARRGAGMADYLAALRAALAPDPVRYDGRFYRIPESEIGPKPLQPGGIPLLIGCYAPAAIERAGRIADGFNPYDTDHDRLAGQVAAFRAAARAAGRDPTALPIVARADGRLTDRPAPDEGRPLFTGTAEQWADDLARLAALGIDHVFFSIDAPLDERLSIMAMLRRRTA